MRFILTGLLFMVLGAINAQDTLRIMHYNLLNYGNEYGDCTSSNNNVDDKNEYLKTLVAYLHPDLLTVNEMDDDPYYHDYLLDNVFNINGSSDFERAFLPNIGSSPIMNQVYYNAQVLTLLSNTAIETNYRDIDIIDFECNAVGNIEPAILHCVVAHLKAGNYPEDALERANETYLLMSYLEDYSLDGNVTLSGDLNLYGGSESAYQNLLLYPVPDFRFYDPLNMTGEWHANASFAGVHTQSTHIIGGCPAGGGMDDRFDFILASEEIISGSNGIKYLPSSYQAVGQDGLHFDQSLIDPPNNSVPPDVLAALYANSDHLPVILDLVINNQTGTPENPAFTELSFENPASGTLQVALSKLNGNLRELHLVDPYGRVLWRMEGTKSQDRVVEIPLDGLNPGFYYLRALSRDYQQLVRKLVICE